MQIGSLTTLGHDHIFCFCFFVFLFFLDMIILLHRRYSMSRPENTILIHEHALNSAPVPLSSVLCRYATLLSTIEMLRPGDSE